MKIAWISDFDLQGSGYLNLSVPLCNGLVSLGHEVKAIGFGYRGQEHYHSFPIIPANNMNEVLGVMQNLVNLWKFDVLVVALDIPMQEMLMGRMPSPRPFKYVGIMPIEADPLCLPWAMVMMAMDKSLVISEFGLKEAEKAGVTNVEHLRLGIDTDAWRPPTEDERSKVRQSLGLEDNVFTVLTVADNQERKNLAKCMEIFSEFAKDKENVKYMMVTREHNPHGWKLRDYAQEVGILQKFMLFERGIGFKELWGVYASSNAFFLGSKAEGLGMPLLEAMAVGLPCLGTNCTGMKELLENNRGFLLDYDYIYRDPFGNGKRYFVGSESAVYYLQALYDRKLSPDLFKARVYVEGRTWQAAVSKLDDVFIELGKQNEQNTPK